MSKKRSEKPGVSNQKQNSTAQQKQNQLRLEQAAMRKRRRLLIMAGACSTLIVALVVGFFLSRDNALPGIQVADLLPSTIDRNGLTLGDPDAPVLLVQYGDYQCEGCSQMTNAALPLLASEYIETGDVAFTYIPNAIKGEESIEAASAALCANDQGMFWEMHQTLSSNLQGENEGGFDRDRLNRMAEKIGLDSEQFAACMDKNTHAGAIQNFHAEALADGITSVPTFLINNGEPFGWSDWAALKDEIDHALGR